MNEVGLDPGIDHMSAMKIIDESQRNGSKVRLGIFICFSSFVCVCLPIVICNLHADQIFHFLVWRSSFS